MGAQSGGSVEWRTSQVRLPSLVGLSGKRLRVTEAFFAGESGHVVVRRDGVSRVLSSGVWDDAFERVLQEKEAR